MKRKLRPFTLLLLILFSNHLNGQDLLSLLDSVDTKKNEISYATGTFKSIRLINGYTCEIPGHRELVFSISHRFGPLNSGFHDFYGLDHSTIRFGFEYGFFDRISVGVGRSSFEDIYDGFVKVKLVRQSTGAKNFPFTITLLEGMAINSEPWNNPDINYPSTARFYYIHELFIARKMNEKLSIQLSPVIVHRNLVKKPTDQNSVPAIGFGGRYKITNHFTVTGEYYYLLPGETAKEFNNSLALGVEIETGGHVFQINLSNSNGMTEKAFIPQTTGKWTKGDIQIGFNIIRTFGNHSHKTKAKN